VTADELPERLAALLEARGIDVTRDSPNPVYEVDPGALGETWAAFKELLVAPIEGAEWDVVNANLADGRLELTRLADSGDGLVGLLLTVEWPGIALPALALPPGAAGGLDPDEDSIALGDWIARVEDALPSSTPGRIVFAPEETGD
jgi:hypothetical protein